ncbi:hypothetical protein WICMUC_005868 [Wickerhamomyces mucosus]|uniref:D-serine dehydratase n=1 Tax=Wickerhamomyces mucosus TaxID=1378264 RepID=A0A9P8P3B8_9ASCO|nr:hypothetical protein WICMUC_005868 [Wickerhamomyces mucosus]
MEVNPKDFIDKHYTELPTPSFLVRERQINENCRLNLNRLSQFNSKFRAHVKTHKTIEGTKKSLGYDLPDYHGQKHDSIVFSTLKEIVEIIKYQTCNQKIFVKDAIYGIPNITTETIPRLIEISRKIERLTLMVDSLDQLETLAKYNYTKDSDHIYWDLIIKLDSGTHRAGIDFNSNYLDKVIRKIIDTENLKLRGFYVHSGHSYNVKSLEEGELKLIEEIETVIKGLQLIELKFPELQYKSDKIIDDELIVSVGATPTLHSLKVNKFNPNLLKLINSLGSRLEFHAGNYTFCDLQQLSTKSIDLSNISIRVLSSVISTYPGRGNEIGEILINAGGIALSREVSNSFEGYGLIQDTQWYINRISQEHGILSPQLNSNNSITKPLDNEGSTHNGKIIELLKVGDKLQIIPNHSCITANSYSYYFILDDNDKVKDIWYPWRGW